MKFKCPVCSDITRCINSRPIEDGHKIKRRRLCETCGFRFSTREEVYIKDVRAAITYDAAYMKALVSELYGIIGEL